MNLTKAFALSIALSGLAIVSGCQREKELPDSDLHEVVFHAGWAPETKTVLQEDGSVWWSPGDEIALFIYPECFTMGDDYKFRLKSDSSEPSPKTDFVGKISVGEGETTYYAIYPYEKARGMTSFTIPSVQYATAGGFSPGQFISFARSTDDNLTFYNVCAGIKFSVAHEGISKIVFKNREDYEPITGDMYVQYRDLFPEEDYIVPSRTSVSNSLTLYPAVGEYFIPGEYYYASIRPGTKSLVVSFYTETQVATVGLVDRSIDRSTVVVLRDIDKDLVFEDSDNYTYATLGSWGGLLPEGIDKDAITEVVFHTSSEVKTETVVPCSIPRYIQYNYYDLDYIPVYFELIGSTAHYYTEADRYRMSGPNCINFREWHELKSIDLSMFDTKQITDFQGMFADCINLESVNLSSFDTSNGLRFTGMFEKCSRLKKLDISNFRSRRGIRNDFADMFFLCNSLVSLDLGDSDIFLDFERIENAMYGFARFSQNCVIRCNSRTKEVLCNPAAGLGNNEKYITWVLPGEVMPELAPHQFDYHSTDFSKDKTYKVLQKASVGEGINIVLMGDGYSDRLIDDGSYDDDMEKTMNAIFKDEPYASFRDFFNVYEVYAVSENEMPGESYTAFETNFFSENLYNIKKYARIPDNNINETCVILLINQSFDQQSEYAIAFTWPGYIIAGDDEYDVTDYAKGGSLIELGRAIGDDFPNVLAHEFGIGFAKLGTESGSNDRSMEEGEKEEILRLANNYGWYSNLDFTNDPTSIKWSKFLSDERYIGTGIGIYEGGHYYMKGVWRPSQNSIMQYGMGMFNAPSREAIYKRIHRLAFGKDWQYDYETFVEYDQKNIAAEKAAQAAPMVLQPPVPEIHGRPFMKMEKSVSTDGKERIRVIMN